MGLVLRSRPVLVGQLLPALFVGLASHKRSPGAGGNPITIRPEECCKTFLSISKRKSGWCGFQISPGRDAEWRSEALDALLIRRVQQNNEEAPDLLKRKRPP